MVHSFGMGVFAGKRRVMRISRTAIVYLHDLVMTAVALVLALYLRVNGEGFGDYGPVLALYGPAAVVIGAVVYRLFGLYRGMWRYASAPDMIQLVKAVTVLAAMVEAAAVLVPAVIAFASPLPRSVPLILWFVLLVLLGGPRFGYRIFKDGRRIRRMIAEGLGEIPVLLVGVGDAAALFIGSLAHAPDAPYRVVGVLDDKDGSRWVGRDIRGVPVLGGLDRLAEVVEELGRRGINELHVEAGHKLNGSLIREGCVDELLLYLAPCLLGDRAQGMADLDELTTLQARRALRIHETRMIDGDLRIIARMA